MTHNSSEWGKGLLSVIPACLQLFAPQNNLEFYLWFVPQNCKAYCLPVCLCVLCCSLIPEEISLKKMYAMVQRHMRLVKNTLTVWVHSSTAASVETLALKCNLSERMRAQKRFLHDLKEKNKVESDLYNSFADNLPIVSFLSWISNVPKVKQVKNAYKHFRLHLGSESESLCLFQIESPFLFMASDQWNIDVFCPPMKFEQWSFFHFNINQKSRWYQMTGNSWKKRQRNMSDHHMETMCVAKC